MGKEARNIGKTEHRPLCIKVKLAWLRRDEPGGGDSATNTQVSVFLRTSWRRALMPHPHLCPVPSVKASEIHLVRNTFWSHCISALEVVHNFLPIV